MCYTLDDEITTVGTSLQCRFFLMINSVRFVDNMRHSQTKALMLLSKIRLCSSFAHISIFGRVGLVSHGCVPLRRLAWQKRDSLIQVL